MDPPRPGGVSSVRKPHLDLRTVEPIGVDPVGRAPTFSAAL